MTIISTTISPRFLHDIYEETFKITGKEGKTHFLKALREAKNTFDLEGRNYNKELFQQIENKLQKELK